MDSSTTSSTFRFRDHSGMENGSHSGNISETTSVSSDADEESDLESMTGQGIKHLCSELLELKLESNEEFHKNIFANYTAFVRIFRGVEHLENELMQLKNHLFTQKRLVKELVEGTYFEVLSNIEDSLSNEPSTSSEWEDHVNNVSETLDLLLSENQVDEALAIIELEDENFQKMQFEKSCPLDELWLYNTEINQRKAKLVFHLTLLAENPRISTPELRKVLGRLCRLGESHLATQLMLKYYHSRIATGICNLQLSRSFSHGVYIRELAKFVFSMIAQAARSFVMLYGETSSYASELIQWALEETKVFVDCFNQYVKSFSEITGGLSTAVEAAQLSVSFCSLLETQRIDLLPYLVKHICPCMEEILHGHVEHFKKVISIFTASDTWVLCRYHVSDIVTEGGFSMAIGKHPEQCLLTDSGRKFISLVQAITEDCTPLIALQMEGSIISGLTNLFKEYIFILERALINETDDNEMGASEINLAVSLEQQISILANLSALEQLFSTMVRGIYGAILRTDADHINEHPIDFQLKENDSFTCFSQEASSQLRVKFCQQFICRLISLEPSNLLIPKICSNGQGDNVPSATFQVLFLDLKKLERLAESNLFDKEWLLQILRDIIEAMFVWISNNNEIWAADEDNLMVEQSVIYKQFVLDIQFRAEISKFGGYFSNNPLVLVDLMKSAFLSTGLNPERVVEWAVDSATEFIWKLLEIEKATMLPNEDSTSILVEEASEDQSEFAANSVEEDTINVSEEDVIAANAETMEVNSDCSGLGASLDLLEVDSIVLLGVENIVHEADDDMPNTVSSEDLAGKASEISQLEVATSVIEKPE
ncbi:hypothetical protein UlMin_031714 [Ulmus minor]